MRKLAVTEFVSLDGVMESPHLWNSPFFDDESGAYKFDELMHTDALLLGRVTYDAFAEAWPGRTDEAGFADRFNSVPKYVVSTTTSNPTWNNSHVISDDVVNAIRALKNEDGEDIVIHGSGKLVNSLLGAGLIDEYRLMISPVVVGSGQRLFPEGTVAPGFQLVSAKAFSRGNVMLTYRPAATKAGS